jgi:mannose-6-phosphate isomerase-like protein (cupin superfamily)
MNSPDQQNASLALARVEPCVTTKLPALDKLSETYTVRKGKEHAEVNGKVYRLNWDESLMIPVDALQRITNDGPEDLEFYGLFTPSFLTTTYVNLEIL